MINRSVRGFKGFTLFEMISVIVVLSIVATLGSKFVFKTTKSYQSIQARSHLASTGRQAMESMSRQLRGALSYSVRITNVNVLAQEACLEFLPIVGGGNYLDPVPDAVNLAPAASTIAVSPHTVDSGSAQYVSIGATASTELYGVTPVSRATLSSRTATLLTLTASKSWQRNSLGQHFFLLDAPQAFCIKSGQLRYYSGQDATSASVNFASAYSLLADSVTITTPFTITSGSENRNTNILFDITFASSGETIELNQMVMILNVP